MLTASPEKHSILIVDDHIIVSDGVELILSTAFELSKVDKVTNGAGFLRKIEEHAYDLVIIDINLPDTNTAACVQEALKRNPGLKILVFSMHPEDLYVKRFLKLGVEGYLNKSEEKTELIRAVDMILRGNKYFSRRTSQILTEELQTGKSSSNPFDILTEKEFSILNYLLKGLRIKEIAGLTQLHVSTIGTQKQRIMQKLGVKNMKELNDLARLYDMII